MTDEQLPRPKFPHLENLDRVLVGDPLYLTRPVSVTEKVHGFNARVGRDAQGVPWYGGRNLAWAFDDPTGDGLNGFRDLAATLDWLPPGVTLYGEWAGKGVQKGIDYGEKKFYLFGERLAGGPVSFSQATLDHYWTLGLTCVPVIYEGPSARLDVLDELRNAESVIVPGQPKEGLVISPLTAILDRHGGQVVAKFKATAFEEVARGPKKERVDLTGDPVWVEAHDFAETYSTTVRMSHVLDQVREALVGEHGQDIFETDPLDVKRTGNVLRTFNEDVLREGSDDYDALSPDAKRLVGKSVNMAAKRLLDEARVEAAREAAEGAAA